MPLFLFLFHLAKAVGEARGVPVHPYPSALLGYGWSAERLVSRLSRALFAPPAMPLLHSFDLQSFALGALSGPLCLLWCLAVGLHTQLFPPSLAFLTQSCTIPFLQLPVSPSSFLQLVDSSPASPFLIFILVALTLQFFSGGPETPAPRSEGPALEPDAGPPSPAPLRRCLARRQPLGTPASTGASSGTSTCGKWTAHRCEGCGSSTCTAHLTSEYSIPLCDQCTDLSGSNPHGGSRVLSCVWNEREWARARRGERIGDLASHGPCIFCGACSAAHCQVCTLRVCAYHLGDSESAPGAPRLTCRPCCMRPDNEYLPLRPPPVGA